MNRTPATAKRRSVTAALAAASALLCASVGALAAGHGGATGPGIPNPSHLEAFGKAPPGAVLHNPFKGNAAVAKAGAALFTAMHCDGCHGAKGAGWVGPNLADRRWRFGGTDADIFNTIFYGRRDGMPAFGGALSKKDVWVLVTYLESLSPPKDEPTESFPSK